ncbi:uncharacterized protein [Anabrus simplex]|uniref:uncharacterized protein n=1 Tax=Anabrus simplex TaxID=316456 RepID=UPI0034DDAE46
MDENCRSDWVSLTQFDKLVREPDNIDQLYLHEVLHRKLGPRIIHDGVDITPETLVELDDFEEACSEEESKEEFVISPKEEDADKPEEVRGSGSERSFLLGIIDSEEDSSSGESLQVSETDSSEDSRSELGSIQMPFSDEVMQQFLEKFPPLPPEGEPLTKPVIRRYESDKPNLNILDEKTPEPQKITILLQETETFFLFELPSVTGLKGTEEGDLIEKDNEQYEYLVAGEGKFRNRKSVGVQSTWLMWRDHATLAPRCEMKDVAVLATRYDLYESLKSDNTSPRKKPAPK